MALQGMWPGAQRHLSKVVPKGARDRAAWAKLEAATGAEGRPHPSMCVFAGLRPGPLTRESEGRMRLPDFQC